MESGVGKSILPLRGSGACTALGLRRALRAFSLLELVVVLLILALLAAVAAPRYANAVTRQRLEAAARRVMVDLGYAQTKAKHTGTARTVSFNLAGHYYDLSNEPHPDHPNKPYRVQLGREPYQARIKSAQFDADSAIVFDGYGMPDSGGTVTLRIGTRQVTVNVDGTTGRISY